MTIHTPPPRPQRTPLAAFFDMPATILAEPAPGSVRAALERHIARCISILDTIDGDSDLEPELGALGSTMAYAASFNQERWAEGQDAEDGGDLEPWLAGACLGPHLDAEHDDCDLEDGADHEPSLGSLGGTAASFSPGVRDVPPTWAGGNDQDREPNGDELDGEEHGSVDDPIFPYLKRCIAAEIDATNAETRRLGAILRRLKR